MNHKRADESAEALYNQALAHHHAGRLGEAHQLYKNILETDPDHADSLHKVGIMALQIGQPAASAEFIGRAIALCSNEAAYHNDLGNALQALGQLDAAEKSYEKAISLKKNFHEAYCNLGNTLNVKGRRDEAAVQYANAIAHRPDFDAAYNNLGSLLRDQGKFAEAAVQLEKAIAIAPHSADAHNNLGLVLRDQGRLDEAAAQFRRVIALKPAFAEAYNNLGLVLRQQGQLAEAVEQYRLALRFNPGLASVYGNLGNALQELCRFDEALTAHQKGLEIDPRNAAGCINMGNVFVDLKRPAEALPWFDKAIALAPDNAVAYKNSGAALKDCGRLEESQASYDQAYSLDPDCEELAGLRQHLKMLLCDWSDYGAAGKIVEKIRKGQLVASPFALVALPATAEDQLACAELYVSRKCPPFPAPFYTGPRAAHDKIRVAYLSSDLREHAVAHLVAGLFEAHDKSKFETTAISFASDKSSMRERLSAAFDHFIDARLMGDDEVARLMLAREVDIAVDLTGFTQNNRAGILARRAAPLQVSYLGFPGTMGAPYIDYIVADKTVIPPGMQKYFSEKVAYLPDTYQPNDRKRAISSPTPSRAELGLPEKAFVFCSFNANYKITPDVFDVWMRLLKAVDNSVLWLLEGSKTVVTNLRREARQRGIAPERLIFAPKMKMEDHLARHRQADLFLDNLPCNAHTTASDALWAGLPVLTCLGGTFAGRVAGSLLKAAGLPELVTRSMAEYEQLALQLAREPQKLAALKEKLAQNRDMCPLFDTERLTRHLEEAYQTMWRRHQQGDAPATFEVN